MNEQDVLKQYWFYAYHIRYYLHTAFHVEIDENLPVNMNVDNFSSLSTYVLDIIDRKIFCNMLTQRSFYA